MFGVVTSVACEFELNKLTSDITNQLPLDANIFFELFIQQADNELIDVPVLIRNLRDGEKQPNLETKDQYIDLDNAKLTHRFFIYDTVSGIDNVNGYARGDKAKVFRLATKVALTVEMDSNENEKINRPLLELTYEEVKIEFTESSTLPVSFLSDYYQGFQKLWKAMVIIFILTNCLALIVACVRQYFFYAHNKPALLLHEFPTQFTYYLFYHIFDVWSTIMFWVCFFTTTYWFLFYKMQRNAKLLLPSIMGYNKPYEFFHIFFLIILITKTLAVFMKVMI